MGPRAVGVSVIGMAKPFMVRQAHHERNRLPYRTPIALSSVPGVNASAFVRRMRYDEASSTTSCYGGPIT